MTNCRWCNSPLGRGSGVNVFRRGIWQYDECRSMRICFNRVLAQRNAMKKIGQQMYNVFFNISQRSEALHPRDPEVFTEMKQEWEMAKARTGF